jgi:hypothetical protein
MSMLELRAGEAVKDTFSEVAGLLSSFDVSMSAIIDSGVRQDSVKRYSLDILCR